ncbi:metal-dependent hydrolase [Candidatus Moduliflexota bacterium]
MTTPIGHSLTAIALWKAFRPRAGKVLFNPWLWLAVISANAPDLDFLPGLIAGDESIFHRSAGHSTGGAGIYGALVFGAVILITGKSRAALAASAIGLSLFGSHLLLDLFTRDPAPPYGMQLFWPFSREYHLSPRTFFPNLDRHPFDLSVVGRALPVAAFELVIFLPLLAVAEAWRRRRPFP